MAVTQTSRTSCQQNNNQYDLDIKDGRTTDDTALVYGVLKAKCAYSPPFEPFCTNCHQLILAATLPYEGLCYCTKVVVLLGHMHVNNKFVAFQTLGRTDEALDLLHGMSESGYYPTIIICNAVIRGLYKIEKIDKAFELFDEMAHNGLNADSVTFTTVIDGLCEAGQLDKALRFWHDIVKPSQIHNDFVYTSL